MLPLDPPASHETAPLPFFAMAGMSSEPPPSADNRRGEPVSLTGRTILVVEDESLVALLIQDAIESAGGALIGPCYTFAEAMAAVRTETFDAAVLDVDLSGEDVFPAADELKRRGIPFLFHTAHADRNEIEARFGDVPLCRKPLRMEDLLSVLTRIAGAGRAN
jgi:CheY-like chemotaxis protein